MVEVVSVGSGSCGNALLVRASGTTILIDCGVGIHRLSGLLDALQTRIDAIDALLLTHEHSDHVRELGRFVAQRTPVLSTRGTARALSLPIELWEEALVEREVRVGDVGIFPIPVNHDAAEPCGFLLRTPAGAISVLTDLGSPSGAAIDAIRESSLVVIEANHDEAMVRGGPYPLHLQRRILSDRGHLSNLDCGELLATALKGSFRLPTIWLAHLSASNNRPQLAQRTVATRLQKAGLRLDISPLPRREASQPWRPDGFQRGVAQLPLDLLA